jgi:hypothetical protein
MVPIKSPVRAEKNFWNRKKGLSRLRRTQDADATCVDADATCVDADARAVGGGLAGFALRDACLSLLVWLRLMRLMRAF